MRWIKEFLSKTMRILKKLLSLPNTLLNRLVL